ncbi:MAG: hypothetical protein L3K11_05450 [Thermoplasmata archaeon]|nr:hypothetical protein [Thermoplasmata archaeon]
MTEPGVTLKQIHLTPSRLVLILGNEMPEPYLPDSLYAFDTNESSLDGVRVRAAAPSDGRRSTFTEFTPKAYQPLPAHLANARLCRIRFPELRAIQSRHFALRRKLSRKKAHDGRVRRRLLRQQGWREHHRIESRLHALSLHLVERAAREHAAIALEDRTGMLSKRWATAQARRRLSSWPRRELHRQIAYKA